MTSAELAAKIKAKYPEYASIPDDELVLKVTTKYPEYKSQLTQGPSASPTPSATPTPELDPANPKANPDPADPKTGLIGGFLQTTPLNPRNLFEVFRGAWKPTAQAGMKAVQDVTSGNLVGAAAGAADIVRGGPAMRALITDPMMEHAMGAGTAIEAGDPLKAAEQIAGAIPGNAGMLALGQENAGNPMALTGNLAGVFTAPRLVGAAGKVAGAGARVASGAAEAVRATPQAQSIASGMGRLTDAVKASAGKDTLNSAASTAIITGGITMNPLAGLAAGAADLMRRIVPDVVERWQNKGASLLEIRVAAKAIEKAEANKVKYRGVSKDEFGQIQDHLRALEIERKQTAKAALPAKSAGSAKSAPVAESPQAVAEKPAQKAAQTAEVASEAPDLLVKAHKSANSILYSERASGAAYTPKEIADGIRRTHPGVSPETATRIASEAVANPIHPETIAGGLAAKGSTVQAIARFLHDSYGISTSAAVKYAKTEVQAMGETMTAAQRADIKALQGLNLRNVGLDLKLKKR